MGRKRRGKKVKGKEIGRRENEEENTHTHKHLSVYSIHTQTHTQHGKHII